MNRRRGLCSIGVILPSAIVPNSLSGDPATDPESAPALLKQHGYHTAGTGKWHLGCNVPMEGDDTLVIFTSDNGCAPYIGVKELEAMGHFASERSRGYKAALLDGGHRMPFIARWPGKVKPASKCDQIVCLTDLLATCAEIVGARLPDNAGEDSISILPLLLGLQKPTRTSAIHHSITGRFIEMKVLACGATPDADTKDLQVLDQKTFKPRL
jgi:arylsulfatase A-like enzyme